ncbi:MAG TPA: NAD-dependent epimerase/dehydratase family protein [Rhodothermales bacterium]
MSHILLTGTAGFIASRTGEMLLDEGHTVVGLDNLNDSCDPRLKQWRLDRLRARDGFSFVHADVSDRDALQRVFESNRFDAVINLAARAGVRPSVENPYIYQETNATGTLNLLELCRRNGVKKFVLASTSSAYGANTEMPYREDQPTDRPLSPYAASKKAAEVMCHTYHYLHGIDVTVFRYFTVYGPAGRPDMAPFRFVQWISEGKPVTVFGDGGQSRDFTYVDDIARGTVLGLKPVGFEVINLGSDTPVVLLDMIRMVEEAVGRTADLRFQPRHAADVVATWADVEKARRIFGWRPQVDLRTGIGNLVAWYQEHRDWARTVSTD